MASAGAAKLPALQATYDVVIVGYGPVGMTCAALLGRYGIKVIVIERYPERYALPRAGHCDGEIMRVFQSLRIADEVELIARPMLSYELVTPDLEVLEKIALGEGGSGWKNSYLWYQPELEAIIDSKARMLGAEIQMGMQAVDLVENAGNIQLSIRATNSPDEAPHTICASYIIGADGAGSFLRAKMGSNRQDLGFRAIDNLVIDFEHNNPDCDLPLLQDVYQVLDTNRPQLAGRWSGRRWSRWEFARVGDETRESLESDETCWKLLSKWGVSPEDGNIVRRAIYCFEASVTDNWRRGRCILAGDSAHTMPPFMGQGMCSGIRDAVNLSWKLAAVLKGQASDHLLDTYELERKHHVSQLIEMSMAVGSNVLTTNPDDGLARDQKLRTGELSHLRLFPRIISGIVRQQTSADSTIVDGRPALQARVAFGKIVARLDDFFEPGWRIISRHPIPDNLLSCVHHQLMSQLELKVAHVSRGAGEGSFVDIDGDYDLWYRKTGQKAFVVRPDNYVFGAARSMQDIPALLDEVAASLKSHGWN